MVLKWFLCMVLFWSFSVLEAAVVRVGAERLFEMPYLSWIQGKKIGLIANQTAIDSRGGTTLARLKEGQVQYGYEIVALFAPEHGFYGELAAGEAVPEGVSDDGIPIHSLHGKSWRLSDPMVKGVDLLIYDIQDIGSRSYTYAATLYFAMEEAAKRKIPVLVLDRPNPINGMTVDGPLLREAWRSPVGYLSIPYCHGMTIGELARYFNGEYGICCDLKVIPMEGWCRAMSFADTGLLWIPTSPYIPEKTTPLYYPMTGILGELRITSIGIGYTLPFRVVGAPWIDAEKFAGALNAQKFPGVTFLPLRFRPQYGRYVGESCQGVLIEVTNHLSFLPVSTQYLILGILKSLYPKKFDELWLASADRISFFNKINGTDEVSALLEKSAPVVWALRALHAEERALFCRRRRTYLLREYPESWHSQQQSAKK